MRGGRGYVAVALLLSLGACAANLQPQPGQVLDVSAMQAKQDKWAWAQDEGFTLVDAALADGPTAPGAQCFEKTRKLGIFVGGGQQVTRTCIAESGARRVYVRKVGAKEWREIPLPEQPSLAEAKEGVEVP